MKNNLIEKIEKRRQLIALIVRSNYKPQRQGFISSLDLTQQIRVMDFQAGDAIQRHTHKIIERKISKTAETIVILSGLVEIDIYDDRNNFIKTVNLRKNDLIFFASGGHGFRFIKKSKFIEIKQGPYLGESDRERF